MKKFFAALGKAALYFAAYFLSQVLVTAAFVAAYVFPKVFGTISSGAEADIAGIAELAAVSVLERGMQVLVVANALTIIFLWIFFLARRKKFAGETGLVRPGAPKLMWVMLPAGLCWQLLIASSLSLLPIPEALLSEYGGAVEIIASGGLFWSVLGTCVLAPLCEEIVFRGLIYSRLKKGAGFWAAILISSAAFGLVHGQSVWIAYAFIFGIVLALVYEASGSLWASILLHFAINSSSYLVQVLPGDDIFLYIYVAASCVLLAIMGIYAFKNRAAREIMPADADTEKMP